jgi:hypothetical protein
LAFSLASEIAVACFCETSGLWRPVYTDQAEHDFCKRFTPVTDAKNAIMLLLAWNAKMTPVIPLDIVVYLVNFLFPADLSFTPRELALSLRDRENFLSALKESNGLEDGVGACYAAIRSHYPILEDSSAYQASINQLIKKGFFNPGEIQKLRSESEQDPLNTCKRFYK